MLKFDAPSMKRHLVLSNCRGFVENLAGLGGYVSQDEKRELCKLKLAVQKRNRSGKVRNRFTGIKELLKASQLLGWSMVCVCVLIV